MIHIESENFWMRTKVTSYQSVLRLSISLFREQILKYGFVILQLSVHFMDMEWNEMESLMYTACSLECLNKKITHVSKKKWREGITMRAWTVHGQDVKILVSITPELWGALLNYLHLVI